MPDETAPRDLASARARFDRHVRSLQDTITDAMRAADPALVVTEDRWSRRDHVGDEGGGGLTRAMRGDVFESAGVNTSCVYGEVDPRFVSQIGGGVPEDPTIAPDVSPSWLWAAGISLIIHPTNPRVPSVHANFRMIQLGRRRWMGGGADLTPFYPHLDDFRFFHRAWRDACAPFGCYPAMKATCDGYFVNHHRDGEMRGIGGIFYDHLASASLADDWTLAMALSGAFVGSYFPLVARRAAEPYEDTDVDFQLHRRGRYVEFNLLHDRGTKFGLQTGGRVESILVSLPARVRFTYDYAPPAGSPHAEMMPLYFPRDWA